MTAQDVEMIGRMLIPTFRDAIRDDLAEVGDRCTKAISASTEATAKTLENHEARLKSLESLKVKALLGWSVLVFIATTIGTAIWNWAKKKLGF